MKAKVLKQLATLQFEVLAYTMKDYKCNTLDELVKKLSLLLHAGGCAPHRIRPAILIRNTDYQVIYYANILAYQ